MATSDAEVAKIVARCRRIGWPVEMNDGGKGWLYRITTPTGDRVQLHSSPSDNYWMANVLRQLDRDGLFTKAEEEWAAEADRKRQQAIAADRERNERATAAALAKSQAATNALTLAAGPLAVREADIEWLLTPHRTEEMRKVIITPAAATAVLNKINTFNRKKRDAHTDYFVAILNAGDFGTTHQGMAIDWNGKLQDGQHRMAAIEKTGKAQTVWMLVGADPANYNKLDSGLQRYARDAAYQRGEKNVRTLTSAARLVYLFDTYGADLAGRGARQRLPIATVDRAVLNYGDELREAVTRTIAIRRELKAFNEAACAAAIFIIGRQMPKNDPRLARFWDDVETGLGFTREDATDPVYVLRRFFTRAADAAGSSKRRIDAIEALALTIKAWNHRCNNRRVHALVWRSNEGFPAHVFLPPPLPDTEDAEPYSEATA